MSIGVMELARSLRELQTDHELDVVSATKRTAFGFITIRFTGVQTPIGVLEDEKGCTVAINVP
jgi:hypothetical protein